MWQPERSPATISNLVKFVQREWFAGDTRMNALQPALGNIIAASDRLTVLIFCDGNSQLDWTPYGSVINQTFQQNFAERKKSRQPFVLLLRTQQGKFTGCTVNFPPGEINVPAFPAWPEPPKPVVELPPPTPAPAPTPTPLTPKSAAVPVPALIIVGTHVGTNLDDLKKISAAAANPVTTTAVTNIPATNSPAATPVPIISPVKSPPPPPPAPPPEPTNVYKPASVASVGETAKPTNTPNNLVRAMTSTHNDNDSSPLRWLLGGGAIGGGGAGLADDGARPASAQQPDH